MTGKPKAWGGRLACFLWRLPWSGIFWRLLGAAAAVWIVALLIMELWERKTSIEPISVPKSLADAGYTPEVAAYRLHDAMERYAKEALERSASNIMLFGNSEIQVAKIALQADAPKIVVPTVGISLDTIATSIRALLGIERHRGISGEFSIKNKLLWLRLRLDGHEFYVSADGVDPESPDDLFAKAMPQIFDAIQPYVVAAAEAGQNPREALKRAERIIARRPESDDNVVLSYILEGVIYRNLGDPARAAQSLNTAVRLAPNLAVPHAFLALIASDRGDLDGAIAEYGAAIRLDSTRPAVFNIRGTAFADKGDQDRAIADFSEAIRLDRTYAYAFNNRAVALAGKGDLVRAITDYDAAIRLDPGYAVAFSNRGNAFRDKGDLDRAIVDHTEAIRLDPNYAYAFNNRGIALADKGDVDNAITDYNEAIRLKPDYAIAFYNRGIAYKNKGNYDRAIEDYGKSIDLQPNDPSPWNNRCVARAITGQLEAALADCNESLRLESQPRVLDSRGLVYLKMGEFDKAIADYDAALKGDPKLAGSLYGRGWAKRKKGDTVGADVDIAAAKALRATIADEFAKYGVD